jgi:phospholipid/cholesterol/gamma-HCH transport system permease protein
LGSDEGLGVRVAGVGEATLARVAAIGAAVGLLVSTLWRIATLRLKLARVVEGIYVFGWRSAAIVSTCALFVGMGLAVQVEIELRRFGASQNIANVVAVSIVRELGPILTALLLAGRAGSGITAELGAMKITDQIQAMRMLGLDPDRHFTAPMLLSTAISTFLLTALFSVVGVAGGYVVAIYELGIPFHAYHELTKDILRSSDVITCLVKSIVFGTIVGWLGCYYGLATQGGGQGLGEATKRSVVASSFAILVSNYFLTRGLVHLLESS